MKTLFIVLVAVGMTFVSARANEDDSGYKVIGKSGSEMFESKVQKVYSLKHGALEYVAYVVKWNGFEVVVSPTMLNKATKLFKVGDTIKCSMTYSENLGSTNFIPNLRFTLLNDFPSDEAVRLKSVEDEVKRRRLEREKSGSKQK